jgi:hypothetical protein
LSLLMRLSRTPSAYLSISGKQLLLFAVATVAASVLVSPSDTSTRTMNVPLLRYV